MSPIGKFRQNSILFGLRCCFFLHISFCLLLYSLRLCVFRRLRLFFTLHCRIHCCRILSLYSFARRCLLCRIFFCSCLLVFCFQNTSFRRIRILIILSCLVVQGLLIHCGCLFHSFIRYCILCLRISGRILCIGHRNRRQCNRKRQYPRCCALHHFSHS